MFISLAIPGNYNFYVIHDCSPVGNFCGIQLSKGWGNSLKSMARNVQYWCWKRKKGPGQTGNVWHLNNIKHCLVTKHADVEVSGQTVKNMFDVTQVKINKHITMADGHKYVKKTRGYKRLSMRGTHARAKHV